MKFNSSSHKTDKTVIGSVRPQVRESHSQEMKGNLSSPIARFAVAALEPGAHYQAALYSYNIKGRSEPVILQASTLRLPEKQLTAEKGKKRAKMAVNTVGNSCGNGENSF